ncbi:hypothetical protein BKA62DRAFT_699233 [Auriculariales sp. MPI-PUGE-AT-0066]|nr:hypothetical protein BKA62DRAFT_699233 [Auriculariales sp. MPI-PUGE-AT-0066]
MLRDDPRPAEADSASSDAGASTSPTNSLRFNSQLNNVEDSPVVLPPRPLQAISAPSSFSRPIQRPRPSINHGIASESSLEDRTTAELTTDAASFSKAFSQPIKPTSVMLVEQNQLYSTANIERVNSNAHSSQNSLALKTSQPIVASTRHAISNYSCSSAPLVGVPVGCPGKGMRPLSINNIASQLNGTKGSSLPFITVDGGPRLIMPPAAAFGGWNTPIRLVFGSITPTTSNPPDMKSLAVLQNEDQDRRQSGDSSSGMSFVDIGSDTPSACGSSAPTSPAPEVDSSVDGQDWSLSTAKQLVDVVVNVEDLLAAEPQGVEFSSSLSSELPPPDRESTPVDSNGAPFLHVKYDLNLSMDDSRNVLHPKGVVHGTTDCVVVPAPVTLPVHTTLNPRANSFHSCLIPFQPAKAPVKTYAAVVAAVEVLPDATSDMNISFDDMPIDMRLRISAAEFEPVRSRMLAASGWNRARMPFSDAKWWMAVTGERFGGSVVNRA